MSCFTQLLHLQLRQEGQLLLLGEEFLPLPGDLILNLPHMDNHSLWVALFIFVVFSFSLIWVGRLGLRLKHSLIAASNEASPAPEVVAPSIETRLSENEEWKNGSIASSNKAAAQVMGVAAIIWNGFSWPAIYPALERGQLRSDEYFLVIFPLIGLALIALAIHLARQWRRFGTSWCEIRGKAGIVGREFAGSIRSSVEFQPSADYQLLLQCVERIVTGTGKQRRTDSHVRWQEMQAISPQGKSSRAGIPFAFRIPNDVLETGDPAAKGSVEWSLTVSAPLDGVNYGALFTVPIFREQPR